jgi:DNA polymerase
MKEWFCRMNTKSDEMKKVESSVTALPSSVLVDLRNESKSFPVIGEGSCDAKVLFIGEAPGKNEALSGRPFCGASGKILDELLSSIHLKREDVYITNVVKDRPPENRDPLPEEMETYSPFLDRQIEIIKPQVIATLGRFSMVYIFEKFGMRDKKLAISDTHGKVYETEELQIIPLYHPAASIYNRKLRETLLKDFKILSKYI